MREIGKDVWNVRIWEDGTFSFGYVPFNIADHEPVEPLPRYDDTTQDLLKYAIEAHGVSKMLEFMKANPEAYPVANPPSALGSSDVPNSHSDRQDRGQNGISTHGKRMVRNAALRLERECGNYLLSFVTLTIPGISASGALKVCENWSEIVRVFQQRLKRSLQRAGLPGEIVGCTEVQENRFAATNVVALHLHLVFQGRFFGGAWALRPADIRAMWKAVLQPYLADVEGELYWDACENVQRVRRSASSYLGKYLSKGIKSCNAIKKVYPDIVLPSCWYTCTNTLRRRVLKHVVFFTDKRMPQFEALCAIGDIQNCFYYIHPVIHQLESGKYITLGYVGKLREEMFDSVRNTLQPPEMDIPF